MKTTGSAPSMLLWAAHGLLVFCFGVGGYFLPIKIHVGMYSCNY
jgi:hypothetical protein